MKITIDLLRGKGICESAAKVFQGEWPNGGELTETAFLRAAELGMDINWMAEEFLTAQALAEYEKATAPAWAQYEKVKAQALAECEKATAQALAEYDKATAPAWAQYEKVKAQAFWAAYKTQAEGGRR